MSGGIELNSRTVKRIYEREYIETCPVGWQSRFIDSVNDWRKRLGCGLWMEMVSDRDLWGGWTPEFDEMPHLYMMPPL